MWRKLRGIALYVAWTVALVAVGGSLYFSNVRHFPPCVLCWYQRIAMYPLVVIFPIGIAKHDKVLPWYVLTLSGFGFLVALYHNLLYYNIFPESVAPCVQGISCTTQFIQWFGFVTIPLLSLTAFFIIILSTIIYWKGMSNEQRN